MENLNNHWYEDWFDTKEYHILYNDRNYADAEIFIKNITHYLNLPEKAEILDLACGKGRHSLAMHRLGYRVTGVDLSQNSIQQAKKYEEEGLHFEVHDMQHSLEHTYDAIFNLFTSFGYFDTKEAHIEVLKHIKNALKPDGFAVIDFLNAPKTLAALVPEETIQKEGIDFHIKRWHDNGKIFKQISFEKEGKTQTFTEELQAYTLQDFEEMIEAAGMYLLDIFGNRQLQKYHKETSDRLILIFK